MQNLILPPSPNWFHHNSTSLCEKTRLLATASFRNLVVYKVPEEKGPLQLLQLIYTQGRVCGLSVHPEQENSSYNGSVAAILDQGTLNVFDAFTGKLTAQFNSQNILKEGTNIMSLSWAFVKGEETVVFTADNGSILLWQPKFSVVKTLNLEIKKSLNLVEVLPHTRDEALVAADKLILHVSLNDGSILNQYKGHDYTIYCIRIFPEVEAPAAFSKAQESSDSWRKQEPSEKAPTVIFASSDSGRNILVWDLALKRYVAQASAPVSSSGSRKNPKDRQQAKNLHIALCWNRGRLFSSSVFGEILEWIATSGQATMRSVTMAHCHSAVIYNIETVGSLLLTFSRDRNINGFDLDSNSKYFELPTMGLSGCSMAFSPHDANRLAVGMNSNGIKLLTFGGSSGVKLQSIASNIRERILFVAWHPTEEGKLLFGSSDGQVGVINVINNNITKFSFHHQKSTYKVEWAPGVAQDKTGLVEQWYAYSFGDRDLIAHMPKNVMQEPVRISDLIELEQPTTGGFHLSEFSFSPNYELLATGYLNGDVRIFDAGTLTCRFVISRVRKVIQHLLWKPQDVTGHYTLAVASGEHSAYIFDLDVEDGIESLESKIITQPNVELSGHSSRCVWLSWSPHDEDLIATSSYDNTVQVWNANTGEPLGNYGAHSHRVFRVEFSPLDSDVVISMAEENSLHEWRISKLSSKTPAETAAAIKEAKKTEMAVIKKGESGYIKENGVTSTSVPSETVKESTRRNASKKSSFPMFHNVSSRKKSFHHMCILSLLESLVANGNNCQEVDVDEDLEELDEPRNNSQVTDPTEEKDILKGHVTSAMEKYSDWMPEEQSMPSVDDVCYYLNFFGDLPQVDSVVQQEIKYHESNENTARANLMHCWQGSLESRIRWAATHKCLDQFLVSAAPQVSFSLWQFACEAYAEQLAANDDPITAASYYVSIHKDEEAVNLLIKHKYYREALVISKYKLGFNKEFMNKVVTAWSVACIYEGNFELSAILQMNLGNTENAARSIARRNDAKSLILAAKLYLNAERPTLANMSAVLAFQDAASKNEFESFEPILEYLPDLHWCKAVHLCQESLLAHKEALKKLISHGMTNGHVETKAKKIVIRDRLVSTVRQVWESENIVPEIYSSYSKEIKDNITSQKQPQSLKQLWFLISVAVSEMILDTFEKESESTWAKLLQTALDYLQQWQKTDQIYYFTHILLPNGIGPSEFDFPVNGEDEEEVLEVLKGSYISSEIKILQTELNNDPNYLPWLHKLPNGSECKQDLQEIKSNGEKSAEEMMSECIIKDAPKTEDGSLLMYSSSDDFIDKFKTYFERYEENEKKLAVLSKILDLLSDREGTPSNLKTLFKD